MAAFWRRLAHQKPARSVRTAIIHQRHVQTDMTGRTSAEQLPGWIEAKFHYAILVADSPKLVADKSEASRRPAANWNLAYYLQRASTSQQVCDQPRTCLRPSVMEFGLDQLRTGLRPRSSRFELSRHAEIARTCSNLVADRFAAGLSQIPLR